MSERKYLNTEKISKKNDFNKKKSEDNRQGGNFVYDMRSFFEVSELSVKDDIKSLVIGLPPSVSAEKFQSVPAEKSDIFDKIKSSKKHKNTVKDKDQDRGQDKGENRSKLMVNEKIRKETELSNKNVSNKNIANKENYDDKVEEPKNRSGRKLLNKEIAIPIIPLNPNFDLL